MYRLDITDVATAALTVSLDNTSVSEAAGAGAATGTVTRSGDLTSALVVTLSSNDTTEATVPTTVTILAGQSSATFAIAAVDDVVVDGTQVVTLTASASGYTSGTSNLNVTDNDTQSLLVSATSLSVTEGATNTFTVRLAYQPAANVTVAVARASGDTDLTVNGGASLTFTSANWNTPQTVTLAAAEDVDVINGAAVFDVASSDLTTINVTAAEVDHDTAVLTVSNVSVIEGSGLLFSVSLDRAVLQSFDVTVNFTAGSATDGTDFDNTPVTLVFLGNAGETQQFTVNTTDDNFVEAIESFGVGLIAGNAAVDDSSTATGSITDNDTAVVTIDDVTVNEVRGHWTLPCR